MKPLSLQLADLSVRAKAAEERIAAAQAEAHERINTRREQIEDEVHNTLNRVEQGFTEAKEEAKGNFAAFQTKVTSDFQNLKDRIARANREREMRLAQNYAEDMAYEAALAIDYATAAIAMAELAALDAIAAREQTQTQTATAAPTLA